MWPPPIFMGETAEILGFTFCNSDALSNVYEIYMGKANKSSIFKKAVELLHLVGYCIADRGASDDRRSITGYGFQLCKGDTLIS